MPLDGLVNQVGLIIIQRDRFAFGVRERLQKVSVNLIDGEFDRCATVFKGIGMSPGLEGCLDLGEQAGEEFARLLIEEIDEAVPLLLLVEAGVEVARLTEPQRSVELIRQVIVVSLEVAEVVSCPDHVHGRIVMDRVS